MKNSHVNNRIMIRAILLSALLLAASFRVGAKDFTLSSPDNKIRAIVAIDKQITYSLSYDGKNYVLPSSISMQFDKENTIGINPVVRNSKTKSVDNTLHPIYGINNRIRERYNELRIDFRSNYSVVFRAYNEGLAWRFETNFDKEIHVLQEQAEFKFAGNYNAYFHPILSESNYRLQKISDSSLAPNYSSMPVLIKPENGMNILIHESDVRDYPCMTLKSAENNPNTLVGRHAYVPSKVKPGGHNNFNLVVTETEDFIAKTTGKRAFPWRLIAFEENDKDILCNELVYLLASKNKLPDTSWIKPGKVAWDWWNAMNLTGVPFKTGFNTETYKYFIDFAAANNIEYINIDDGWSDWFDLLKVTGKLDMQEVAQYAKSKNVGIFLWCVWWTIDKQMTEALDLFRKWGIAGIKVDFMDRDDQIVVDFHERLLKEAAKRNLLVNYHGAYHPTGMSRTYPNNINVEGVRGLEWNKFNPEGVTPGHDVTIPFIRMFAGSMDYTPGAMQNYNKEEWKQLNDRPMSQGTRCHQLAMFVVYYGSLQMLSDAPTAYEKEPDYLKFLAKIPSVWDETYPLDCKVGEYVNVARRKGNDWYIGGMTNWNSRKASVTLDFLDAGKQYAAEIFTDGANADRVGNDYAIARKTVKRGEKLEFYMAPGGGYAVRLTPAGEGSAEAQGNYKVVMFGNSLIEGGGNWNEKLGRNDVRNSGRGGFTTSHFVWLLDDHVIKFQPEVCVLEGGINDMGVGISAERIKQNYQNMVDRLLEKNIAPILTGVFYVSQENDSDNADKAAMIDEVNAFLQELAKSKKIAYIDINPQLSENKRLKKQFTTDGVHLTEVAYNIWAEEIKKVLNSKK